MSIHYISPYDAVNKNIGGAINKSIEQLNINSSDWIVHIDHDVLFLRPDSKAQLEHILQTTKYDLLGPLTNRLAQRYQLVPDMFGVTDIRAHVDIANGLHTSHYGQTQSTPNVLAAFCLCFRKSVWDACRFRESSLQFDSQFSIAAKRAGFRAAIMTGLYVFHAYRLWSTNPRQDIRHLQMLPERHRL